MLDQATAKMPTVIFATPSTTHSVCLDYLNSAVETDRLMREKGCGVGHLQIGGDCYLWKVRSKLATRFLRDFPDATDLFFLDDDVGWPAPKVLEFLLRPEDILVGIYPKKSDQLDFPVELMGGDDGRPVERGGLYRVLSAGAGFCRIKRHVLEHMADKVPLFKEVEHGHESAYHGLFAEGIVDGWAWGEDKYFFALAQQEGFEIWADPDISFTHRGTKTWRATLGDHIKAFTAAAVDHVVAANTQAAE